MHTLWYTTLLATLIVWSTHSLQSFVGGQLHPDTPARYRTLPSLREQARILDQWRDERIARIPDLLKRYGVDVWLISQREYAEDTLWWSIKSATEYAPHRRTILLFHTNTSSIDHPPNPLKWVDNGPGPWTELLNALETINPKSIAVNTDRDISFGGGLHVGELAEMVTYLGRKWVGRFVSEPMLGVEYVAGRVDGMLQYYKLLQETTWALIEEAFSEKVIEVGVTSTEDVEWWYREKMLTLNVSTWNHPRVSVITPSSFPGWSGTKDIIHPGSLLHVDFGITSMNMNTDVQHMAYVLRPGENDAPVGLKEGLMKANRMQEIVLRRMRVGKTGNEVLRECLSDMREEGISGQVYSHPIGDWGHSAGAVIGFTNLPEYVPVLGELPLLPNTYYSIELYAYHFVPERNETLRFRVEENVHWVSEERGWEFVYGRQERLHLVRSRDVDDSQGIVFRVQS